MASKKISALDFARAHLKEKPEATFAEVRDEAKKKKLVLFPIVYGRAKALEGLVEVAPYGSKKKQKKKRKARATKVDRSGPRTPSRRRKSENPIDSIEAVIASMRESSEQRERYRAALIEILKILNRTLD